VVRPDVDPDRIEAPHYLRLVQDLDDELDYRDLAVAQLDPRSRVLVVRDIPDRSVSPSLAPNARRHGVREELSHPDHDLFRCSGDQGLECIVQPFVEGFAGEDLVHEVHVGGDLGGCVAADPAGPGRLPWQRDPLFRAEDS
jgi:hypothetical protein